MRSEAVDKEVIHSLEVYGIHESFARHLVSLLAVLTSLRGDDPQDYKGAGVKRTMVAAIECISANGRSSLPVIIWPATTHRSNWTTFPTPG